jgi:GT2 family glycosyltransferase
MVGPVGVVVVNWEQASKSLTCLRSVLAAGGVRVLAVLVDNGSTESLAEIEECLPDVRLVRLRSNLGYAAACNAGASRALAEGAQHLLFLNNDAQLEGGTLGALMAANARHPDAIIAPKIVYAEDPEHLWSAGGDVRRPWMQNRHFGQGELAVNHSVSRRVGWATGCALFCSARTFQRVGPLDEGFFLYLEDVDWCLRAGRFGVEVWYEPDAVILHEVSATTSRLPEPDVLYYGCRNTYRVAFRHSPALLRGGMAINVAWTLTKVVLRNAVSSSHRNDPLYRARTQALFDFVFGRKGARSQPAVPRRRVPITKRRLGPGRP